MELWLVEDITLNDDAREHVKSLLNLVSERLSYMPEMGKIKRRLKMATYVPEREKAVMDNALKTAREIGLDEGLTRRFIQGQMDAAKALQEQSQEVSKLSEQDAKSKMQEIRDQLIKLSPQVLNNLHLVEEHIDCLAFRTEVDRQLDLLQPDSPLQDQEIRKIVTDSLFPAH